MFFLFLTSLIFYESVICLTQESTFPVKYSVVEVTLEVIGTSHCDEHGSREKMCSTSLISSILPESTYPHCKVNLETLRNFSRLHHLLPTPSLKQLASFRPHDSELTFLTCRAGIFLFDSGPCNLLQCSKFSKGEDCF